MLFWFIRDLVKKQLRWEKAVILLVLCVHLFCLLLHRTFGGFQLGARYCVDFIPYSFLYVMISPEKKKLALWEGIFLGLIFVFTYWGMSQVHI